MLQSILLFPELSNLSQIENFRRQFDPLFDKIDPHITLVFPFESELTTDELRKHISGCITDTPPFPIILGHPKFQPDGYIWLPVLQNGEIITRLHDKLYTGILGQYLRPDIPYTPHLTIGRITHDVDAQTSATAFPPHTTAHINTLSIEQIQPDNSSLVTANILL